MVTVEAVFREENVDTEIGEGYAKYHVSMGTSSKGLARHLLNKFYENPAPGYEHVVLRAKDFRTEDVGEELKEKYPEDSELINSLREATIKKQKIHIEVQGLRR